MASLAEEARHLKDEVDVLRHTADKVVSRIKLSTPSYLPTLLFYFSGIHDWYSLKVLL